ncbi:unnamed protein product [Ectocarpus fasciculatus]
MFGNSGGDVGYGAQQQGYQTRSRGRGRDGPPEGQLVEGDLFGNPKHQSFRPTDPPAGVAPRGAYHDATAGGGGGVGGNAFRNNGAGAGGYGQTPAAAQPSPFARGPSPMNASFSGAGGGSAAGPGYSAGGYNDPGQTAPPPQQQQQHGFGPRVGFSSEVALVPVEASGNSRGRNVMDDDDDDDIPTRSLADVPDDVRDGGVLFGGGEGLRSRRAGGGGGGGAAATGWVAGLTGLAVTTRRLTRRGRLGSWCGAYHPASRTKFSSASCSSATWWSNGGTRAATGYTSSTPRDCRRRRRSRRGTGRA